MELRNPPKISEAGTQILKNASSGARDRILIADRNPVLSQTLATHLGNTAQLECIHVSHSANLSNAVSEIMPDILIVDPAHLGLTPDNDISDFGGHMRTAHRDTRLLGYSFTVTLAMLRGVLDAGFRGCVSKNAKLSQLETAIEAILDDGVYFDHDFGAQLRSIFVNQPSDDILSDREKEILVGFARGLSAKQIAYELKISSKTVDTYKSRACQKLDLRDRSKLVDYVLEQGWLA